ncbi:MAG: lipopolysaccharide biosynthesis protein [Armatimonadota bacterium]
MTTVTPTASSRLPLGEIREADPSLAEHQVSAAPPDTGAVAQGRFALNIFANIANFAVGLFVGFWFTPYLIHHLDIASYGLISLATTLTGYLGLFTMALNSAVGRYLTIALTRQNEEEANRYFNTSLFGTLLLCGILLGPSIGFAWHIDHVINVPAGLEVLQVRVLFLCTLAVFLLATIGTPFEVSSFCCNRFDLRNMVAIGGTLFRIALVVTLFTFTIPSLAKVGIGLLAGAVIAFFGALIIWRILTPGLHIQGHHFSWTAMKQLTSTGGWVTVNNAGALLFLGIDLLVVNKLLGAQAGGHYAAILQWSALLRAFAGVIASVFAPTITAYYARGDMDGLIRYSRLAVKFLGLVMALPIGLICGLSYPLLQIWLGKPFAGLAPLLSLMTIHLCINLGIVPLFNLQMAANRVRWPGIVTFITGAINLGLALLLADRVGWGMYGVAAAGAIMLTAKNAVFTPLYGAHILRKPLLTFFRELLPIVVMTVLVAGIGWGAARIWSLTSWLSLIGVGLLLSLVYVVAVVAGCLSPQERQIALRLLPFRQVWQR